jgi:hypothetical protein
MATKTTRFRFILKITFFAPRSFHSSPVWLGIQEDRVRIMQDQRNMLDKDREIRAKLNEHNKSITEFIAHLANHKQVDERFWNECRTFVGPMNQTNNQIQSDYKASVDSTHPNGCKLDLEIKKCVATWSIDTNVKNSNDGLLTMLDPVQPKLYGADYTHQIDLVRKHIELEAEMEAHHEKKAKDLERKIDFHRDYNQDWNHGSLIDDYADLMQDMPSYMDPED